MSQVILKVGGRAYTVSCADGEEAHVEHLATIIEGKLTALGGSLAPGDAKNLLFAALILADEVEDARSLNAAAGATGGGDTDGAAARIEENIARALEALADRIEAVAETLEHAG